MIDLEKANHTNRELELMLAGVKPLAMFYDEISCLPDESIIPEAKFLPHVESGQFVRSETLVTGSYIEKLGRNAEVKYVFYAPRNEVWRINAIKLLVEQWYKTDEWNQTCTRLESALLGYTDEEIDAWCEKNFPRAL